MWETHLTPPIVLSHDMPCLYCGHALHIYLACGDACDCGPHEMPGLTDPEPVQRFAA
jgi:hypothetical protein